MNPYASPTTSEPSRQLVRQFPFDVGKVVGRYLQALALFSIISAAIEALFFDRLRVEFIPLLMLVFGHNLAAHRSGARTAMIWLLSLILVLALVITISGFVWGTENISIRFVRDIEDPRLSHVLVFAGLVFVLIGTPLWLLLTSQAKAEFAKERRLSFEQLDTPPDKWTDDDDP